MGTDNNKFKIAEGSEYPRYVANNSPLIHFRETTLMRSFELRATPMGYKVILRVFEHPSINDNLPHTHDLGQLKANKYGILIPYFANQSDMYYLNEVDLKTLIKAAKDLKLNPATQSMKEMFEVAGIVKKEDNGTL